MKILYALLAIAGAAWTWHHNLAFMEATGGGLTSFDVGAFVAGGFANHAAASLSADLVIGSTAFLVFMVHESRRLGIRRWWPFFLLTFLVAFAFAAPLFLFVRQRHLEATAPCT